MADKSMGNRDFIQAGYVSSERVIRRDAECQARRLKCCGVAPEAHGANWAPGLLGTDCFIHLTELEQDIAGSIHVDMRLVQHRPVELDRALTVRARTVDATPAPRGEMLKLAFQFHDGDGDAAVECEIGLLMPGPQTPSAPQRKKGDVGDDGAGFEKLRERTLSPDDVRNYGGAGNPIHDDPAFAKSRGFRAPIAHGVMTAVWLLSALDRPGAPTALDAGFAFRRPVFWDDDMELWGDPVSGRYRALNAAAKLTAEMSVAEAGSA